MEFKILNKNYFETGNYAILPYREEDKFKIKEWRNQQINILRQKQPLTDADQISYYANFILPSFSQEKPRIMLFSFLENNTCIGYGGLTNIDWEDKRVELSFLIDTKRAVIHDQYEADFSAFLTLIKKVVFEELKLNRIFGESYDLRPHHLIVMEKNGFRREGCMKQHICVNGHFKDALLHGFLKEYYIPADTEKKTILITSISKKVGLLKAVKAAADKLGNFALIGADSDKNAIGKYFVTTFWQMPPLFELTVADVISYCKANNVKLIIPTRDGELPFWASLKNTLHTNGISVLVSPEETVQLCLDKLKFYTALSGLNLPVIPTVAAINKLPAVSAFVVKERFGAGSFSLGLNLTREQAIEHAKHMKNPIFQPYIVGRELSVDIYIDKKGKAKGVIARSRDLVVNGESQVTTMVDHPALENLAVTLTEKIKLYGPVVLQVLIDATENIHIIECNSRFGGASTLSVNCGLDSFYWALLEVTGNDISELPFFKSKSKKSQVRFPEDMLIDN